MPFFSIVGNEAQYVEFNDDLAGLGVDNVQDAIDAVVDDSVLIDTDPVVTGFTQLAENPADTLPPVLYGTSAPSSGTGSDGDYFFDATGNALYLKTSGTWNQISPFSISYTGFWPTSPAPVGYTYSANVAAAANANSGVTHVIVVNPPQSSPPITSQSQMRGLFLINRTYPVADQDIIVWDGSTSAWTTTPNDADAVNYDNTVSALTATNVQDAIDELVQDLADGLDGQNEASEITYDNVTSGLDATDVQAAIDELVQDLSDGLDAQNEASEITYDNATSGLVATDVQAAIDELVQDLSDGLDAQNEASEITYDNATSNLAATDVQAALDEIVDEQFSITAVGWEPTPWLTLITGAGAPTSSDGQPGWFWFDTTGEDLYGPAFFDNTIPGMNWGSALANVVFDTVAPTNEVGDWFVQDDSGTYILYQNKTTISNNDLTRANYSGDWVAVTPKVSGEDVYLDLTVVESSFGVTNARNAVANLESFATKTFAGYWSDKWEEEISGTYEVPAGYANNFYLTLTGNTTLNLPTDMDAAAGYSEGLAGKSSEISVILVQGPSGPYTLTWGTMVSVPQGGITLTPHADEADWFKLITFDNGVTWFLSRLGHRYSV